jgi:hypothetical protein
MVRAAGSAVPGNGLLDGKSRDKASPMPHNQSSVRLHVYLARGVAAQSA